ncbi:predicted protein [Sclerotinia sclerotiorum 1980 UF-70]|uniref:Uncharacterized protein n=1 Tax=Sclerotinia sclerotiorum (strain ATCC 18683 / 1980 / Ss-1) TaxID=665079 RepID=A7F6B7_SCLS1|nr:predicted protein [Sclerotinia sclerotiorum 1980 UF-70]EDN98288.1 predicted protein [Sclerotinia sclerotiorum 1980 UF-70]
MKPIGLETTHEGYIWHNVDTGGQMAKKKSAKDPHGLQRSSTITASQRSRLKKAKSIYTRRTVQSKFISDVTTSKENLNKQTPELEIKVFLVFSVIGV